jgi:hypothetical protein
MTASDNASETITITRAQYSAMFYCVLCVYGSHPKHDELQRRLGERGFAEAVADAMAGYHVTVTPNVKFCTTLPDLDTGDAQWL